MPSLDYVEIPPYATRLQSASARTASPPRIAPKFTTPLPQPDAPGIHRPELSPPGSPTTGRAGGVGGMLVSNLSTALFSSTIPGGATDARAETAGGPTPLLTARDPLSIPTTTAYFRRFVPRAGPVFWLQDRIEEIYLWRCGSAYTCAWMAGYTFLCYFPRLILLIPHAGLIAILLAKYPRENAAQSADTPTSGVPTLPREGSADWLATLQAIQNLMGAYSDGYDSILPHLAPLMSHTRSSRLILLVAILTFIGSVPLLPLVPLRLVALVGGLFPFVLAHPFVQARLPLLILALHTLAVRKHLPERLIQLRDDDALPDAAWRAPMREVSLFENERRVPGSSSVVQQPTSPVLLDDARMFFPETAAIVIPGAEGTWSKGALRAGERAGWTRGADGWSGIGNGQVSSNLTFALEDGWRFVETEDWRPDLTGSWAGCVCDEFGWVYTNDSWHDPRPIPAEEWRQTGATRRRRWTRRIYLPQSKMTDT